MQFTGVTYQNTELTDLPTFERLDGELKGFIEQVNGLVAYNGGIQFRGCVKDPKWISLEEVWTGASALYKTYDILTASDIPFAQDGFGDQFILRNNVVYRLSSEYGDLENLDVTLFGFIGEIIKNPVEYLMLAAFNDLYEMGVKLDSGQLINVMPPFIIETEETRSYKPVSTFEQLEFLKNIYQQTKNLEDGQQIRLDRI